jgi:hypothetical protein
MLAQGITLLTGTQEMAVSNFSRDTDCPDRGYAWLSLVLPGKIEIIPEIRLRPFPSTYIPVHYSLIIPPFDAIYSELLAESLNKP